MTIRIEDLEGLPGLLYLRKSRKDIEQEREAAEAGRPYDTLQKHREELYRMVRQYKLHVVDELKEIVSGEFIAERPEMQKVLEQLTEGDIRWVGVVDEDRLGRGDKVDQGRIERAFKHSEALIITPSKIVDMNDEADEMYMDYKGQGARYEYKQIKKRLQSGRRRSARQGNYVGGRRPYGYLRGIDLKTEYPQYIQHFAERAADIENYKLYPHPDEAPVVRLIYKWYLECVDDNVGIRTIMRRLKGNYPTPRGKLLWARSSIKRILSNPIYVGTIIYGARKFLKQEDGSYIVRKVKDAIKIEVAENAHEPIVSKADFQLVQDIANGRNHLPVNHAKSLANPFAGILKCEFCQLSMTLQPRYKEGRNPRLTCLNPNCLKNKSIVFEEVENRVLEQIEQYYQSLKANPSLVKRQKTNDATLQLLERKKQQILDSIEETKGQQNELFDLLERKVYTIEMFMQRQKMLGERINTQNNELRSTEEDIQRESQKQKKTVDIAPRLETIVKRYRKLKTIEEKNRLLRTVIDKMYYRKDKHLKSKDDFSLRVVWAE